MLLINTWHVDFPSLVWCVINLEMQKTKKMKTCMQNTKKLGSSRHTHQTHPHTHTHACCVSQFSGCGRPLITADWPRSTVLIPPVLQMQPMTAALLLPPTFATVWRLLQMEVELAAAPSKPPPHDPTPTHKEGTVTCPLTPLGDSMEQRQAAKGCSQRCIIMRQPTNQLDARS